MYNKSQKPGLATNQPLEPAFSLIGGWSYGRTAEIGSQQAPSLSYIVLCWILL